jgi:predicted nucleic acid-binding protein
LRKLKVLPDTNLFISAAKSGITKSTALIFKLCFDESIELVGNSVLLEEYERYIELTGKSGRILLEIIRNRMMIVEPDRESIELCRPYIPEGEYADLYHAATCLKADATLITNDRDFEKIREAGLIRVWNISEAIENLGV